LAAAAYDHRFKAIIVSSAPIDLLAGYGGLDPRDRVSLKNGINLPFTYGWSEGGQGAMKVPAWRAGAMYEKASPYYHMDNLTSAILLFQGDADQVGLDQSERLLSGLYRLRRDAILIRYWGESHTPVTPGNIKDIYARISWFLNRTIPLHADILVNSPCRRAP
jgi:dipeptidyl aminopeptidase/acylaminoacyl peptidase